MICVSKSDFPFLYNTNENNDYIREIPDKKYFFTENISNEELKTFENWHGNLNNTNYIWRKQF